MTENEAMSVLHYLLGCENAVDAGEIDEHNCLNSQEKEALKFVLEEIQQYRAIGTVEDITDGIKQSEEEFNMLTEYLKIGTIEEFKALKEKNEPKEMDRFYCPICRHYFEATDAYNYCPCCGQKMKPIWQ